VIENNGRVFYSVIINFDLFVRILAYMHDKGLREGDIIMLQDNITQLSNALKQSDYAMFEKVKGLLIGTLANRQQTFVGEVGQRFV
jgi:hypothetical protein